MRGSPEGNRSHVPFDVEELTPFDRDEAIHGALSFYTVSLVMVLVLDIFARIQGYQEIPPLTYAEFVLPITAAGFFASGFSSKAALAE